MVSSFFLDDYIGSKEAYICRKNLQLVSNDFSLLLLFIRMLFSLIPSAINNARGAIGWEWFHRSVKTFSPFSSHTPTYTTAVKELPFGAPCTVTALEGSRKSAAAAATASNATLNAPFVEQPCHGVKSSTRGPPG